MQMTKISSILWGLRQIVIRYQNKFKRAIHNQLKSIALSKTIRIQSIGLQLMIPYTREGMGLRES